MLEPSERLRHAIQEGNLAITKRLLSRFPELWLNRDSKNKGWSNLHYASYHGHYLICFYLVSFINKTYESYLDVYSKTDLLTFDDLTVLHLPLINFQSQTLHYLLQEFPGEYWKNYPGGPLRRTPLHCSCVHGFKEGTSLLLEFGADWMLQDAEGDTCLHLCFQYGYIECVKSIIRYILVDAKDKDTGASRIKELEAVKNNKGWNAVNYASNFDMVKVYGDIKDDLFSINFSRTEHTATFDLGSANSSSLHLVDTNSSDSSLSNHRVLASPIVPVWKSQASSGLVKSKQDESDETMQKARAHSQSLPACPETEDPQQSKEAGVRQRSHSTYTKPQNNAISHQSSIASLSHTPRLQQFSLAETPSLKSVTISPSVRAPSNRDDLSSGSSSQRNSTNSSPLVRSPTDVSFKGIGVDLLKFDRNDTDITSDTDKWPSIDAIPNQIEPQVIALSNAKSFNSRNNIYEEKSSPISAAPPIQSQDRAFFENARRSSRSSPSATAERTPMNTSKTSLNESPVRSRRTSVSRRPSYEVSPMLRKASPTNAIPNYNSSKARSSSTSTFASVSDSNSDLSKSSKISSISFNRVR